MRLSPVELAKSSVRCDVARLSTNVSSIIVTFRNLFVPELLHFVTLFFISNFGRMRLQEIMLHDQLKIDSEASLSEVCIS